VRARVKGFTTFEARIDFRRFFISFFVTCVLLFAILVFGDSIRFSDPPTLAPTVVSAKKHLTMPPQKKSKKNIPTETDKKSTTMTKTTESLSLQNLHIPQIKNEEQNLRLSKRLELRRQHIL
jgi:hypothetical protein